MFAASRPLVSVTGPFGIRLQVHVTLLLLPLLFISLRSPDTLHYDLLFIAMLIGSIFLHELGHAWGCLFQGVPVRRIMLHGGGGFCEYDRPTTAFQQELIIAMGPIVNLTIWAFASLTVPLLGVSMTAWALGWLAQMNLFLALFNLMPMQPLDGGKLLQLGLMRLFTPHAAVRIAGAIGLTLTVLWVPGMIWLYLNVGLVLFFFPSFALHLRMLRVKK